jgi:predicted nucleic acid-binding protein
MLHISESGEFWNVMTRPVNRNGYGFSPADADLLATEFKVGLRLLPDAPDVHIEWRRLLVAHGISGIQVHDARLVASMHVHGVKRILTFNTRDFTRFTGIEAIHPADFKN